MLKLLSYAIKKHNLLYYEIVSLVFLDNPFVLMKLEIEINFYTQFRLLNPLCVPNFIINKFNGKLYYKMHHLRYPEMLQVNSSPINYKL